MMKVIATIAALGMLAGPVLAEQQSYRMMLGSRQIGTLVFDGQGSNAMLKSTLDDTPLGVANGTFDAVTRTDGDAVEYVSVSQGSKSREIAVSRTGATVTAVTITPTSEETKLSDVAQVPAGVISPTETFGILANGGTCPAPLAMYDGRRVIQIATTAATQDGANVSCEMSYRVVAGPGHLSPFRFKKIGMQIDYASGALAQITMSAGGFAVQMIRQ